MKDGLGICLVCAKTCHEGHNVEVGYYGLTTETFCDCGNYKIFNQLPKEKKFKCEQLAKKYDKGIKKDKGLIRLDYE